MVSLPNALRPAWSATAGAGAPSLSRRGLSSAAGGHRIVHVQLLLRGGHRTPLEPLEPEKFWRDTLPPLSMYERMEKMCPAVGGARRAVHPGMDDIWGELTVRGADESYGMGQKLERWLFERPLDPAISHEAEKDGDSDDSEAEPEPVRTRAFAPDERRSIFSARRVLSGLRPVDLKHKVPVTVDCSAAAKLHVELPSSLLSEVSSLGDAARQDAALDLTELLALPPDSLLGASWSRLLDVAECASIFGLVTKGDMAEATWKAVLTQPLRTAKALAADAELAVQTLGPLLDFVLSPCSRAASSRGSHEQLRVTILPASSLLFLAAALRLGRLATIWPTFASGILMETVLDPSGVPYVQLWQPRDYWPLRPAWHKDEGPINLKRLREELRLSP